MNEQTLVDISKDASLDNWQIVNDGVMGGLSDSAFTIDNEKYGTFKGNISLENYGGFASVKYNLDRNIPEYSKIALYVRGDKKRYQFRIKASQREAYSYVQNFETNGEWQRIVLDLADFYPTYRGRILDLPNYTPSTLSEIRFLIGNKTAESFHLDIDKITLLP